MDDLNKMSIPELLTLLRKTAKDAAPKPGFGAFIAMAAEESCDKIQAEIISRIS